MFDTRTKHDSRERDRVTHLKFLPGVSDAFNTYSYINGTLRQCNHGNRHQDYVKERHTKDQKMLCLKQWQHSPERKDKKELKTEISKVPRQEARNLLRTARAAPAECVYLYKSHCGDTSTQTHFGDSRSPQGKLWNFSVQTWFLLRNSVGVWGQACRGVFVLVFLHYLNRVPAPETCSQCEVRQLWGDQNAGPHNVNQ